MNATETMQRRSFDNPDEVRPAGSGVGVVPPGHDAWTVGDEPVVYLDITGSAVWAKPA